MGNHKARTRSYESPMAALGRELAEATDPRTLPGKVRTLADMTPEERAEMLRLYATLPTK